MKTHSPPQSGAEDAALVDEAGEPVAEDSLAADGPADISADGPPDAPPESQER